MKLEASFPQTFVMAQLLTFTFYILHCLLHPFFCCLMSTPDDNTIGRNYFLTLLFCIWAFNGAQADSFLDRNDIDSLIHIAATKVSTNPDTAVYITELLLNQPDKSTIQEARAWEILGAAKAILYENEQAMNAFKKSLDIYRAANAPKEMSNVLMGMHRLVWQQKNGTLATEYMKESVDVLRNQPGLELNLAEKLMELSLSYQRQDRKKEALEIIDDAINIFRGKEDQHRLAKALFQKSRLTGNPQDLKNAFQQQSSLLKVFEELRDTAGIMRANNMMGQLAYQLRDFDEALAYYKKTLDLYQLRTPFILPHCVLLNNYSAIAMENGQVELALEGLEQAMECAADKNNLDLKARLSGTMASAYAQAKDFEKAFDYQLKHQEFMDSIQALSFQEEMAQLLAGHERKEQESKIQLLELMGQKRIRERNLLIMGLGLLLLLMIYVISISRIRRRSYLRIKEEKEHSEQLLLEKEQILQKLAQAQNQIIQSEKMASLGQLTAGIAHEINNPINFMNSSATALGMDLTELQPLFDVVIEEADSDNPAILGRKVQQLNREIDFSFVVEEIGQLMTGIHRGNSRVQAIISSLRTFAHHSEDSYEDADMHELIENTLTILNSAVVAKKLSVERQFMNLPKVPCQPGKISQVLMNILDNAIKASPDKGTISIRIESSEQEILVAIKDQGPGIEKPIQKKIFDPFFTTKEVGEGTGLGLSISYSIIKEHQGRIELSSTPGQGSEFRVYLPIS